MKYLVPLQLNGLNFFRQECRCMLPTLQKVVLWKTYRPPLFTAQEITTPVTIFSAEHDTLANPVVGVAPPCIQCNNILYVKQLSTMCVIQLSTMCVIEHSNMSYNTVIYVSCDTICVIHNIYKRLHQHIVRYIKVAYNDRALVGDSLYTVIGIARLESER